MNDRLNLTIDIFDAKDQVAQVLSNLDEQGLIGAILQEFGDEFDFLGADPAAYRLLRSEDNTSLDPETPIGEQLKQRTHLVLADLESPLPLNAKPPASSVYLRDAVGENVFKLNWLPAIIGRPDNSHPQNELLAVNLESYATGLRVSRRHAQILVEDGEYYVEGMASNPTLLQKPGDLDPIDVTTERQRLEHGDVIKLSRSTIDLRFVVRD